MTARAECCPGVPLIGPFRSPRNAERQKPPRTPQGGRTRGAGSLAPRGGASGAPPFRVGVLDFQVVDPNGRRAALKARNLGLAEHRPPPSRGRWPWPSAEALGAELARVPTGTGGGHRRL